MFKKLSLISIVIILITACNSNQKQPAEDQNNTVKEPVMISVNDFENNASEIVGEKIIIEGTVNHVCQHGGKRMFLIDTVSDATVKIIVGENIPSFNTDLEGQDVIVTGVIDELRIDEDYLTEWENELMMEAEEGEGHDDGSGHEGSKKGEAADQGEHVSGLEKIKNYRQEIKESGTDHLSFYSIICEEYKVIEPEDQE